MMHFLLFLAGVYFSIHFYPQAFPVVDLKIKMDRTQALEAAKTLALKNQWAPENFQQAASFDSDQATQTFIELEAGGKKRFSEVIQEKLYAPYTWTVRHFKEGSINEALISFTPEGDFYGFRLSLPETQPGAALKPEEALKIAEKSAETDWKINLSNFQLVEKSSTTQLSKRVDHLFVYEQKNQNLGDGSFRLSLSVSGDRLSGIRHSVEVPDAFTRKYGEMRSANNTIAGISSAAMLVLYLFGGCAFGIFYLARKKWLLWKPPLIAAGIVALLQGLERLNQLPLAWMQYDTAIPKAAFLLKSFLSANLVFLGDFFVLSLSFMAAESLSRLAYPKHPQLWRIWSPRNASTYEVLGRTLGGYLSVGMFFAYVVCIYIVGSQLLGWWSPADILFQPDALASYFPWFTSISQSLHAGFWEESLFRAVPLASAALIGDRLGRRKLWITLGFVVQALIFATAHANYPAQPSYARVVELILPSIGFGLIYLNFGLLPGIILHFTFDVISFAIPLFVSTSPRAWVEQTMVVLLTLLPLIIVLFGRLRTGRWGHLEGSALNQGWTPIASAERVTTETPSRTLLPVSTFSYRVIQILGVTCLALSFTSFRPQSDTWNLNVTRDEAIRLARDYWKSELNADWEPQARLLSSETLADEFVWKVGGPQAYRQLLGSYLSPPVWSVRFVRFNVSVAERAESFQVIIARNRQILGSAHIVPEERALKSLTEEQARILALKRIESESQLKPPRIQEVASSAIKQPHRVDWFFTLRDQDTPLKEGEARLSVYLSGEQVTSSSRFVFVPEDWVRHDRGQKTTIRILNSTCWMTLVLLALAAFSYCLIQWTQKKFDATSFKSAYFFFLALGVARMLNALPASIANFSTVEPKLNQWISLFLFDFIKIAMTAFFPALLLGYLRFQAKVGLPQQAKRSPWNRIGTGLSIGVIFYVLLGAAQSVLTQEFPKIPDFQALTEYFTPLFGLNVFQNFCLFSLILLFIYQTLARLSSQGSRRLVSGFLLVLVLSLAVAGSQAQNFLECGLIGSVGALLISFAIYFPLRGDPALIPLATAGYVILGQIRQIMLQPYPEITVTAGLSILLVGVGSLLWYNSILWSPKRT